jgi:hypothetical protein
MNNERKQNEEKDWKFAILLAIIYALLGGG